MTRWAPCLDFWLGRGFPSPRPEYRFHPTKRWRFDFCWPERKIAIEVDGGIYIQGRHARGAGMEGDMKKLNEAQRLGWKVFRFTPKQMSLRETADFLRAVFNGE